MQNPQSSAFESKFMQIPNQIPKKHDQIIAAKVMKMTTTIFFTNLIDFDYILQLKSKYFPFSKTSTFSFDSFINSSLNNPFWIHLTMKTNPRIKLKAGFVMKERRREETEKKWRNGKGMSR